MYLVTYTLHDHFVIVYLMLITWTAMMLWMLSAVTNSR